MASVDVYLSPSVQEFNVGYGNYGTEEERMNQVADIVEYELRRNGLRVVRNSPEQSLQEIVAESNALAPSVHVAIHSNASSNGEARGSEVYAHKFGGKGEILARDIARYLEPLTPTEDFGVKEGYTAFNGKGYYELRRTTAPAVLVEVAFHDNPEDAQFIMDNIYEIGVAIARGILNYFGKPYTPDTQQNIDYLREKYNGK